MKDSIDKDIKEIDKIVKNQASEIFNSLVLDLETENIIPIDKLRNLLQIHSVEPNTNLNKKAVGMISAYKVKENIINGNFNDKSYYNETLDKNEFIDLLSADKTKNILFPNTCKSLSKETNINNVESINNKRKNIDLYTQLFMLFADTKDGITAKGLSKCLKITFESINNLEYKKDYSNVSNLDEYTKYSEDIISILGSKESKTLSLEDFVNIMTSNAEIYV